VFSEGKTIFTYGFKYNREQIIEEWLLAKMPKKSLKELFRRTGSEIQIDAQNYSEASDIHGRFKLNGNRLFLSLVGQAGGEISNTVIAWFTKKLKVVSGLNDAGYANFTKNLIHDDMDKKARILEFVQEMKVGFSEVTTRSLNVEDMKFPSGFPAELISQFKGQTFIEVSSHHNVYDESGNVVGVEKFEIEEKESAGTNKIFNMAGPILDALTNGKVLCIDELDSQMHPMLTWKLVEIFNNQERNPYGAQLIFTTHDTNLLSKQLLRRDQIWFVEKDPKESTKIYPLKDYIMDNGHKPRTDSNYEKNYLAGKYGAIPDLNSTIEDSLKEE
jgi:AAA15 family ATPase/GTPase